MGKFIAGMLTGAVAIMAVGAVLVAKEEKAKQAKPSDNTAANDSEKPE